MPMTFVVGECSSGETKLGKLRVAFGHHYHKINCEIPNLSKKLLEWPLLNKILLVKGY